MKRGALALLVVACTAPCALGQSLGSGIDKISAYAGTWKTETEHFDTKFSKTARESKTLRNDCWSSGEYFACHQFVDGKAAALIVYTYNQKEDAYKSYVIPADGGDASTGKLLIKENVWTFPWEDKDDAGKIYYFQVVNVWSGPRAIEYRTEFSDDHVHWTIASKGHENKVP
jgi:hypothetical protein